ncbi:MAG: LacI family transcriptional regulator [Lachnospiraceae bacterium]|nr:LacI family transcriptional regulator [Lachnospiraceae bacterium]
MSVTIRDVAAAAGVSKATVSKVLNNSYTISKETTDRVNEVIREMGYLPNRRAQSFASRSTKTILFLARMQHGVGFDNPHLFEILAGIESALSQKGYGLIVKKASAEELCGHFDELLRSEYVDGAILHASVVSREAAGLLAESEVPYIVVGMPDFSNHLCWIDTDNSVAGETAARHLLQCGYERIAFIGGPEEDRISAHRKNGVMAALNGRLPEEYLRVGRADSAGGRQEAEVLLGLPEPPDAVICANQYIAFGCVGALKASGVRIPEETAVITFDDFPFSRVMEPELTVVNLDMYDMGEQAAKLVLRRIKKPQLVVQSQTTLPVLIRRGSTAQAPRRM